MVNSPHYKIKQFACFTIFVVVLEFTNAEESPASIPQSIPLPVGHLKPLGSHRPPDVQIDDLHEVPSPQEFLEKYVRQERAAIFRGASKESPAFKLWTDEYLKEKYGNLEVRLEGKKEKGDAHIPQGDKGLGRSTIDHFIDHYHTTNRYMVSELPTPMYPEVFVPPCLSCGMLQDRLVEIDIWMSSQNSQSVLHKDAFNSLNCLLNGTKQWKLFERKYEKWLHKSWEPDYEVGGFSEIDVNKVDMIKHPNISKVPWSYFTINAGDCLFLPSRYYHQVTSIGETNLAVAILFSFNLPSKDQNQGCKKAKPEYLPLSDYEVSWEWKGDDGYMTMGHTDIWELRDLWLEMASADGSLSVDDMMQDPLGQGDADSQQVLQYPKHIHPEGELIEKTWKYIDPEGKGYLTEEDIRNLEPDALRQFALGIEPEEPSNTHIYEYFYVEYKDLKYLIQRLAEIHGFLERETFYTMYQDLFGGSEGYAKQIFDKLTNDPTKDKALPEDVATNLEVALEEYRVNKLTFPTKPDEDTETDELFTPKDEL